MAVSANIFKKCLPAIGTDIKHCGTVTICDVSIVSEEDLPSVFADAAGNYRVMNALLMQDFEIKMCGAITNGLYDFLVANSIDMSRRIGKVPIGTGRFQIQPFVLAAQKSRLNNEYWTVSDGTDPGGANDWQIDAVSQTGMPSDVRFFNLRDRVYIDGVTAGGTATRTAWRINATPTIVAGKVRILLVSENTDSNLAAAKLESPVTGILVRGTPNVNSYEEWCEEGPGLNNNKLVPFWIEEVRNAMCSSDLYDQYRDYIIDQNEYYKTFVDVPEVEKNKQLGADWQRRWLNSFFWNKALPNQNLSDWQKADPDGLERINTAASALALPDEAECVGFRANAIGVYEQLAECGRVRDLQGQVLNLPELFKALYEIQRVRQANNQPADSIDIFVDSYFAKLIQQAMVRYFKSISEDTLAMQYDITNAPTKGKFGFRFTSYPLDWPALTLNVISHPFFDDRVSAGKAVSANMGKVSRFLWILDFAGIYPGIIASERVVNSTGDLQTRAKVDSTYLCVMKVPTRRVTLTSTVYTAVVECPESNLLLENIAETIPEHAAESGALDYYGEAA